MSNTRDAACKDSIIQRIARAVIGSGYTTLDAQAMALGLRRSTAWYIMKSKHKIGRLSQKVRQKMLANPNLPPLVRKELEYPEASRTKVTQTELLGVPADQRRHVLIAKAPDHIGGFLISRRPIRSDCLSLPLPAPAEQA